MTKKKSQGLFSKIKNKVLSKKKSNEPASEKDFEEVDVKNIDLEDDFEDNFEDNFDEDLKEDFEEEVTEFGDDLNHNSDNTAELEPPEIKTDLKNSTQTKEISREQLKNLEEMKLDEEDDDLEEIDFNQIKPMSIKRPSSQRKKFLESASDFLASMRNKISSISFGTKSSKSPFSKTTGQSLSWDFFIEKIFSTSSQSSIHKVFFISLVFASSYNSGKITALIIKGPEKKEKIKSSIPSIPKQSSYANLGNIHKKNLFNAVVDEEVNLGENKKTKKIVKVDQKKICNKASKSSSLPISLINTTVLQDSVKSIASVSLRGKKKLKEFREGENIDGMAKVGRIERLKVVIKNLKSGECEYLESKKLKKSASLKSLNIISEKDGKNLIDSQKPTGISNIGNKFTIKKSLRDEMLADIGNVLTQARAIQIKNPDGSLCFKMTEIVPGSIYSHLSIQNEDIICKINGSEINDLNAIMSMFGKIKEIDNLSISVDRDGSETELEYEFN